jgi:hypothetical protein
MPKRLLIQFQRFNGNNGTSYMVYEDGVGIGLWMMLNEQRKGVASDRNNQRIISQRLYSPSGNADFFYYDHNGNLIDTIPGTPGAWTEMLALSENALQALEWTGGGSGNGVLVSRNFADASIIHTTIGDTGGYSGNNRGAASFDNMTWWLIRYFGGPAILQRIDDTGNTTTATLSFGFSRVDCDSMAVLENGDLVIAALLYEDEEPSDFRIMRITPTGTVVDEISLWAIDIGTIYYSASIVPEPGGKFPIWIGIIHPGGTTWELRRWEADGSLSDQLVSITRDDLGNPSPSQLLYVDSWAWMEYPTGRRVRPLRQRQQDHDIRQRQRVI